MSELRDAWSAAVANVVEITDPNPKALAFGAHYRIQLGYALAAVWATAKAIAAGLGAIATLNPLQAFEAGAEAFAAVASTLQAVRRRLGAGEYLVLTVLSRASQGCTAAELEDQLRIYFEADVRLFPWYSGIDDDLLKRAQVQLYDAAQVGNVLRNLAHDDWIRWEQDKAFFQDRHLELNLFPS